MYYSTNEITERLDGLKRELDLAVTAKDSAQLRDLLGDVESWEYDRENLADELGDALDAVVELEGVGEELAAEIAGALEELTEELTLAEAAPTYTLPWLDSSALTVGDAREIALICGPLCTPESWDTLVSMYGGSGLTEDSVMRILTDSGILVALWIGEDARGDQMMPVRKWVSVARMAVLTATGEWCRAALSMIDGDDE